MKTKINFILISLVLSFGCMEQKVDYLKEGEILFVNNQNDKEKIIKSIEYFKQELLENPDSKQAAKYLAIAYSQLSMPDSAQIILSQLIKSQENEMAGLYHLRGMSKFIIKDYDGSIADFENAINEYHGNSEIYKQIIISKIWQKYNNDGVWLEFTTADIAEIIDEVYPTDIEKPNAEEFKYIAQ